jgi:hypothetical protein
MAISLQHRFNCILLETPDLTHSDSGPDIAVYLLLKGELMATASTKERSVSL